MSHTFKQSKLWATLSSAGFSTFISIKPDELARQVQDFFKSETNRLKNAEVMETGTPPPDAGDDDVLRTPSQILYDPDSNYPEVNRTYVSLWALQWILAGDYDRFTRGQPGVVKLKDTTFQWLKQYYEHNLKTPEQLLTLITAIMVNDVGKDPQLKVDLKEKTGEICEGNHDIVLYRAVKAEMIPSLQNIEKNSVHLIMKGIQMGSDFNAAQLAQAENVPVNLEGLLIMKGDEPAFNLKFMEIILDVAGASGHIFSNGVKNFIEPVCQAFITTKEVCLSIVQGKSTLREGYDIVLSKRAALLAECGFRHLQVDNPEERALLRLLTMGRTANKQQAQLFEGAFDSLPSQAKQELVIGLNVDAIKDNEVAVLPYYAPAMFAETIRNTKNSDKQQEALTSLMTYLSRVLQPPKEEESDANSSMLAWLAKHWRQWLHQAGRVYERDISCAREIINREDFKTSYSLLDTFRVPEGYYLSRPHANQSI